MHIFNNREIAIAIWFLVFLIFALRSTEIRRSIVDLIKIAFGVQILIPVFLMILYTMIIVKLFSRIGLWDISLLKDTIIWFCLNATVMMARSITSDDVENIFYTLFIENLRIIILLEFLVNTYTFSLLVELAIIPLIALIVMIDVIAKSKDEFIPVSKLIGGLQIVVGLVIITVVIKEALSDLQNLQSWDTIKNISLAPFLSLMISPYLFLVVLYSKYAEVFARLDIGAEKTEELKRYARRRIYIYAKLNPKRIQQLLKNHAIDLMQIQTRFGIDDLLKSDVET